MPLMISRKVQSRGRPRLAGDVRRQDGPFRISQIGFVAGRSSAMLLTGGRGPHGALQRVSATPWNRIDPGHSTSRSRVTMSLHLRQPTPNFETASEAAAAFGDEHVLRADDL